MGLIYAYSFYVLWFVYVRIQSGLELTLKARLSSIHRTMTCKMPCLVCFISLIYG
jgi:hypothetical protein